MVTEDSIQAFIASKKTQHSQGQTATPKATNVARDSNINAVKTALKSDISTAKFTQERDLSHFRDIIKPVLANLSVPWLTAQELIALFHNNLFEFSNAEKFTFEISTDWSEYLGQLYIFSAGVGELIRFDTNSIHSLVTGGKQFHQDEIPSEVYHGRAKHELCEISMPEVETAFHRFIIINYEEVAVCRSAPQRAGVTLLASPSDN